MRNFDNHDAGDPRKHTQWRNTDAEGVILEGEIVGESVHVASTGSEPVWGVNAAGFGRKLLVAMMILAALVVIVPLTLAFLAVLVVAALVGRLLLGRQMTVARWAPPWGAR